MPPKGRSVLAGIVGLFGVIGYIVAAYVGVGFSYWQTTTAAQWRAPIAIGCFPPLLLLAVMPWLPESPRWLLAQDRHDEAWGIIQRLHTSKEDPAHDYAKREFHQMKRQHELDRDLSSSWLAILRRPSYRKRAIIVASLPVILYSTGNLVVTSKSAHVPHRTGLTATSAYAASIFTGIGYDAHQSLQLLAGLYVAAIAGNLISLTYVDRIPRNVVFAVGVLAVTVVLSIETALVATYVGTTNSAGLSAAAAFLFLFLCVFNLFLEGPSFYYAAEVFPTHLRSKGMTIAVCSFCIINILWLELAPTAIAAIEWRYYIVFICLSVPGAAVIYFTFPDTLGLPLEEVARLFGDEDLIAIYQQDIHVDHEKHEVIETVERAQHI